VAQDPISVQVRHRVSIKPLEWKKTFGVPAPVDIKVTNITEVDCNEVVEIEPPPPDCGNDP